MFDLSSLLDLLTRGNKGRVAMEAAIAEGYVEDPEAMRAYYDANRSAIEGWFEQTDVEAVIEDLRSSSSGSVPDVSESNGTVGLSAVGAATGAIITYAITK